MIKMLKVLMRKVDSMHKNIVNFHRNMETLNKNKIEKLETKMQYQI